MSQNGWIGEPIDIVEMPDGIYTTLDNTRVVAAREAGIYVAANVHKYDEPLDDWQVERFTTAKGAPSTWGEAVNLRIGKQNSTFRKNYQYGSFDIKNVK